MRTLKAFVFMPLQESIIKLGTTPWTGHFSDEFYALFYHFIPENLFKETMVVGCHSNEKLFESKADSLNCSALVQSFDCKKPEEF